MFKNGFAPDSRQRNRREIHGPLAKPSKAFRSLCWENGENNFTLGHCQKSGSVWCESLVFSLMLILFCQGSLVFCLVSVPFSHAGNLLSHAGKLLYHAGNLLSHVRNLLCHVRNLHSLVRTARTHVFSAGSRASMWLWRESFVR